MGKPSCPSHVPKTLTQSSSCLGETSSNIDMKTHINVDSLDTKMKHGRYEVALLSNLISTHSLCRFHQNIPLLYDSPYCLHLRYKEECHMYNYQSWSANLCEKSRRKLNIYAFEGTLIVMDLIAYSRCSTTMVSLSE